MKASTTLHAYLTTDVARKSAIKDKKIPMQLTLDQSHRDLSSVLFFFRSHLQDPVRSLRPACVYRIPGRIPALSASLRPTCAYRIPVRIPALSASLRPACAYRIPPYPCALRLASVSAAYSVCSHHPGCLLSMNSIRILPYSSRTSSAHPRRPFPFPRVH